MTVLVTGGAGYIGSVTVGMLRAKGIGAVVLDNLVHGHRASVEGDVPFYEGNAGDAELVGQIVAEHKVSACIHFAGYAYVGESVGDPHKYFDNNVVQTVELLKALVGSGVMNVVFSSSCASYGNPVQIPMDETHPQHPVNPYGWTKFMAERILDSYDTAYGLKSVSLRYFNAAGATDIHGEHHDPETHLIPLVLNAAAGESPAVSVFGNDYDTPDGTCIRDYVHVTDLADGHIRALNYLAQGGSLTQINLGSQNGSSVLEVIEAAQRVTGATITVDMAARRDGDPARLVADAGLARNILGWNSQYSDLETIIRSAWDWKQAHPHGYEE